MEHWSLTTWGIFGVAGLAALHGLHRAGLYLERKGLIYYLHNKPKGSSIGSFVALQQALEPRVQHVLHIKEENRQYAEEDESAERDPMSTAPPRPDDEEERTISPG